MSKAADEEEPEVIVKRKPGGFICRLEPVGTRTLMTLKMDNSASMDSK